MGPKQRSPDLPDFLSLNSVTMRGLVSVRVYNIGADPKDKS